jgi:hypothetical protein
MKKIILAACIVHAGAVGAQGQTAQAIPAPKKAAFMRSEPIDKSFVFYDGEYLEPPYVVSRSNLAVCVNGRVVADFSSRVQPALQPPQERPALPPTITGNSTLKDEELRKYVGAMSRWFSQEQDYETKAAEMMTALKALPCLKEVRREKKPYDSAVMTFQDGTTERIGLVLPRPGRKSSYTAENIGTYVDDACESYARRLRSGIVSSIFRRVERLSYRISDDDAPAQILDVALSTELSDKEKASLLAKEMQLDIDPADGHPDFVRKLAANKPFEARVKKLVEAKERRKKEPKGLQQNEHGQNR